MIIDNFDVRPGAGCCLHDVADQREIGVVVRARVARRVHELDREIDALGGCIGPLQRHDVFFPQDRRRSLDDEARALIAVGDHAFADQDLLVRLEFDFQRHGRSVGGRCRVELSSRMVNQM